MSNKSEEKFRSFASKLIISVFVAATVLMLVTGLVMRAELTAKNAEANALKAELSELSSEKRKLMIELETQTDLAEIEDYAKNVLGMQMPSPWQRRIISTNGDNIYEPCSNSNRDEAEDWISSFTEYFGLD